MNITREGREEQYEDNRGGERKEQHNMIKEVGEVITIGQPVSNNKIPRKRQK